MDRYEEEEEIDLGKLFSIMVDKKKQIAAIVGICTAVAMGTSFMLPKEYTSNVTVQVEGSNASAISGASAMLAMMGGGSGATGKAATYIELMKTRTVLDPIIEQVYGDIEEEKRPDAKGFAKGNLEIENIKGTQLISVNAKGRTPEEANYITENVITNFLDLMTSLNKENKSLMVSFLEERINQTQKEAEDAALALETYSKEHKIYIPEEQVAAVLTKHAAYDKTLGEIQVAKLSSSAKFNSASEQLGEQSDNAKQYNIAENSSVQKIRNAIIDKEMELVKLRQNYQEKHPDVIKAVEELETLKQQLTREVATVVNSEVVAANDVQQELMVVKYQAATELAVASSTEDKIRELQQTAESELEQLSDDGLMYKKLAADVELKKEVYAGLVKQIETAKIQQTMESMDIQVIDPPTLPDEKKPTGPKKKVITAIGFAIGMIISLIYSAVLYYKSEH